MYIYTYTYLSQYIYITIVLKRVEDINTKSVESFHRFIDYDKLDVYRCFAQV